MDRLRKRAEFVAAQRGARAHARAFVVQARVRPDPEPAAPRLGLTITKKVGTAVERNRIRRRLRAAADLAATACRPGIDYVVVARREAICEPFSRLTSELARAFAHAARKPARLRATLGEPLPSTRPDGATSRIGDDHDDR